jgi:hypothetical protein
VKKSTVAHASRRSSSAGKKRKQPESRVETIDDYFTALAGKFWDDKDSLEWPPDVFCLLASLLHRTGAYIRLVKDWPPPGFDGKPHPVVSDWTKEMARRGEKWWSYVFHRKRAEVLAVRGSALTAKKPIDARIADAWRRVVANRGLSISELISHRSDIMHAELWMAVFEMIVSADEACWGIGVSQQSTYMSKSERNEPDWFLFYASTRLGWKKSAHTGLEDSLASASLCLKIPPYLGSVLPKMHTPQCGLTLRSLTHNLAYIRPTEVSITFQSTFSRAGFFYERYDELTPSHSLNVLLVPWPMDVRPSDFEPVDCATQSIAEGFRFFTFHPKRPGLKQRTVALGKMLSSAKDIVGKVDGVLLPELALASGDEKAVAKEIWTKAPNAFLISGIGSNSVKGRFGTNKAIFAPGRFSKAVEQEKHHRWQLDGSQLDQYGLGSKLDPNEKWWEHIPIEKREISFFGVSERILLSLLICEDLARQDPIADVIHSVGPNLVIALLMDGPQLSGRWPAHYATVLADDPGSSVLTVTSIGMSRLCRPKGVAASRVVGLWRDRIHGFREITLPEGADALVVTLTLVDKQEWSADGRGDGIHSTYLTLNGVHPVFTKTLH